MQAFDIYSVVNFKQIDEQPFPQIRRNTILSSHHDYNLDWRLWAYIICICIVVLVTGNGAARSGGTPDGIRVCKILKFKLVEFNAVRWIKQKQVLIEKLS